MRSLPPPVLLPCRQAVQCKAVLPPSAFLWALLSSLPNRHPLPPLPAPQPLSRFHAYHPAAPPAICCTHFLCRSTCPLPVVAIALQPSYYHHSGCTQQPLRPIVTTRLTSHATERQRPVGDTELSRRCSMSWRAAQAPGSPAAASSASVCGSTSAVAPRRAPTRLLPAMCRMGGAGSRVTRVV